VSTGSQSLPHGVHWPHRKLLWLVVGLVAAAAIAVGVGRALFAGHETRSEHMQGILDGVVTGPHRLAPGATAYVLGPHGTWVGSAGVADVKTGEPMPVDARMRIESNSKTWLVAVVLQLLQEGKLSLDDTVDRWLPGLLVPSH
jgi:D-alanyl-D-alanine carboxypeptidase